MGKYDNEAQTRKEGEGALNIVINSVEGLPEAETDMLRELIEVWQNKLERNDLKVSYYNSKNRLKDLGISIPPPLKDVETVVGWPAKAVDALAARSRFDGYTFPDGNDHGLTEIMQRNNFRKVYSKAVLDELITSCAFITVSAGGQGEPGAIVSAYTSLQASAIWDMRQKRIKCGLTVVDIEKKEPYGEPEPVWVNLYTDDSVWEIKKTETGWTSRRNRHSMGRPMIEPLAYRSTLERPFGRSRISRAVMSITDSAVRCALRSEVAAEFNTAPQKYILGADADVFGDKSRWEAYIGNWLLLTRDEEGEMPSVGQLSQGSMQQHIDYMRSLAARFSGETAVPVSELGIIHDNPSSAEAIYAAKETLVIEAENLNEDNGEALKNIGMMAIALSQGKSMEELTDEERSIIPRFKNPARPSLVSQADAIVKAASVFPWLADSTVALEEFGFDEDQVMRLLADKTKAQAMAMMQAAAETGTQAKEPTMYEMSSIIKSYRSGKISRSNAITLFDQIGVDETRASEILADAADIADTIAGEVDDGDIA